MSPLRDRRVFFLGAGQSDTREVSPAAVGNKAFQLMRLDRAGVRVPSAVVLGTDWMQDGARAASVTNATPFVHQFRRLEQVTGLGFGSGRRPLIVSIRSGAPVSMPGMMSTVVNVGLTTRTVQGLIRRTGNPGLAWDSYRRLIESFGQVVHGLPLAPFEHVRHDLLERHGAVRMSELSTRALRDLAGQAEVVYADLVGRPFPQRAPEQLDRAIRAVFQSWDSERAVAYRAMHDIDPALGTAVMVQRMVFGNAGGASGSGVGFTRNPATGVRELYVDFAWNGQGEDVVAGRDVLQDTEALGRVMPAVLGEIQRLCGILEHEFGDAQDFEFTVEDGVLFLLQTRSAKRTPWAALQIAVDLMEEDVVSPASGRALLADVDVERIARSRLAESEHHPVLARAVSAGPGVASGPVALDVEAVGAWDRRCAPILVRPTIETEDIRAFSAAGAILTARGGRTSHGAVVARELGKPCLVGCADLVVCLDSRTVRIGGRTLREGDMVTVDGDAGVVYDGAVHVVVERPVALLKRLAALAPEPADPARVGVDGEAPRHRS